MRRATLYALAWLAFTVGVMVFHAGCGSSSKPVAKPEPKPKQTDQIPLVCIRVEREDKSEVIVCANERMCQHIHQRLLHLWEPLATRYGTTGLSECTAVSVLFTQR